MKKISFLIAVCCLWAVFDGRAQHTNHTSPYTVSGKVTDKTDHAPVAFTTVTLHHAADSSSAGYALTDSSGAFVISCKKAGNYYLQVHDMKYKTFQSAAFNVSAGTAHVTVADILLEQAEHALSEVEVIGRRRQVTYKLDKQVIDASGFISAAGGTALDILSQTPSVRIDADGGISFRGSSGFKVYIDDKPAAQDLEQIPVGQIENIEIITTPSAKNDADGSAGIINIITKKQYADGWSGMINLMGSSALSRNVDFLTAFRKKNFRWQLSGEASRRYVVSDFDQLKTITTPDTLTTDHSAGIRERHTDVYYLRSGWDWFKKNTTWSAATQAGYRDRWRGGELHYEDAYTSTANGNTRYDTLNGKDFVHLYEWFVREDIGMEHRFPNREGHLLTAALYAFYEGNAMENFQTDLWNLNGQQAQGHRAWEYEYRFTAQANADYVYPFDNKAGKLEAGYQLYTYTENGDYNIDMYNPNAGAFQRRDDLYNKYLFRRDIHALYLMASHSYKQFSYQAGLRSEYSFWKLGNNREWARHTRHKLDFFPSVHLAYQLNDNDRLRFAYSRRITQPELFYMEPYVVYVDYYTAQCGNPFILPEYTNSVELGYQKKIGKTSLSAALFHRARKDKIERIRIPYHVGVTLDSMTNVGNDYATGMELMVTIPIYTWWNFDANGSWYDYQIKNDFKIAGKDEESQNWQLAVNNNFDIKRNTRMRLEAYYVGPSVSTQGRIKEFFYLNFTIRQQLLNRRLTASLVIRDVLSTAQYVSARSSADMETLTTIYPRSPLFTATLSYTFNNFKSQKKSEAVNHDLFEGTNR
ncbi:MAG: TonB-dependent receptor [Prevotellaceae bacterium]|jgi:outer membrane receptor protein involved in Fe transport|nr:TonB-dependent receptor [Prevotellaceae bacterium]